MNKNPIISVVMPVYNSELYLDKAIESILLQTYQNFEFIIINDGSTDRSLEIIEKYKNSDARIILINKKNSGIVEALNDGIKLSKGKYIARMDSDDISLPNRFMEQIHFINDMKVDVCGSWIQTLKEDGLWDVSKNPEKHEDISFRLFFMTSFAHPSVLIKKDIFETVQYENVTAEDYKLWCDITLKGYRLGNVQKVLLHYRVHSNQLTRTKMEANIESTNEIKLNFARLSNNKNIYPIVRQIPIYQKLPTFKNFNNLLIDIVNISQTYAITDSNLLYIIRNLYNNLKSKNPLLYYAYYKSTKNLSKNFKEEFILFIKSFILINGDSRFYYLLKKINKL